MPSLIARSPELQGQTFQLEGNLVTIGRNDDNSLTIAHPSISSNHCELKLEGGDYRVVDLGSTNGTRVNDERINESLLRNQDVVMLGNILFTYQSEVSSAAAPLPTSEARVDLTASINSSRPANFSNLAPFAKPKAKGGGIPMLVLLAFLIAVGSSGWFVFATFLS